MPVDPNHRYVNEAHVETIVVWKRGDKALIKQRHDRCIHPSGPHPQNAEITGG